MRKLSMSHAILVFVTPSANFNQCWFLTVVSFTQALDPLLAVMVLYPYSFAYASMGQTPSFVKFSKPKMPYKTVMGSHVSRSTDPRPTYH